jgi:pimeloyl-ACP methyl ester carboxylesterase
MKSITCFLLTCLLLFTANAQQLPNSLTDGKYITVNGAKLWVVLVGKGDPLVIIPGGPGNNHYAYRRFDPPAANNLLVYFDAFGRGKSDTAKDVKEYTLARDIEDIEGLRMALHLDKMNVLGHSYGGVVAQGYALKYPQHVKHLILANTFHSYVMWQENDDNSNHEIQENYPEIWDTLMILRNQGYVSSDSISSWIDTITNVNQSLVYQQTLWDICEIYTRQFRKALRDNRKKMANGTKIAEELNNQFMEAFSKRRIDYDGEANFGTSEIKQKEWEVQIQKELAELSDFAYDN